MLFHQISQDHLTHSDPVPHTLISKLTIVVSEYDLSHGMCQAIIRTYAERLLIRTWGKSIQRNLKRNSWFCIHENAFENIVWKMAAILSRPQCVNQCHWGNHEEYRKTNQWHSAGLQYLQCVSNGYTVCQWRYCSLALSHWYHIYPLRVNGSMTTKQITKTCVYSMDCITVPSHEHRSISNNRQLECLFN